MRAWLALLLALSTLVRPASPARADERGELAKMHFAAGREAFESGEYQTAVREFTASWEMGHVPDVLINVATAYERIYQPDKARACYERFLAESKEPSALHTLAEKRLRVLRTLPGSISVETNKDARIALEGPSGPAAADAGAPNRFDNLPPGRYHVRVTLPDHVTAEEDVTLTPAESKTLPLRLAHQVEQLTIFSVPDGARVFLDDHEEGITPFSRSIETGHGRHLRLEAPDFPAYRETIDVAAGTPVYRQIRMPRPRRSGRTELVLGAMAFGGFAAGAITVAIGGTRVTTGTGLIAPVSAAIAGVGVGFLGAWALSSDDMKVGHASIINGGMLWGGVLGISLAAGLGLTSPSDPRETQQNTLALTVLGGGVGLGVGILSAWLADPSAGDAALVNSGGLWGTASGLLFTEAINFRSADHDRALGFITLGTASLGLATSALFARYTEVSRGHAAIIDLSAAIGLALGYGIGYAAGKDGQDPMSGEVLCPGNATYRCVTGARWALGGMAVGLLGASILTARYYKKLPEVEALVTRHGDRLAFALPSLRLDVRRAPEGLDRQLILDIAKGEF